MHTWEPRLRRVLAGDEPAPLLVLVEGGAGMGKSRLVQRLGEAPEAVVVRRWSPDDDGPPRLDQNDATLLIVEDVHRADDVVIEDAGYWAESTINVTGRSGNGPDGLKVTVDIKHEYVGDLVVELVAPNGLYWPLKEANYYEDGTDLVTSYLLDASTVPANGTWRLRVADVYEGYTGFVDSWSLTF